MATHRNDRVSEQIRKELARIIREEVKNPHIPTDMLSVVSAEASRDLSHAKVKISVYGDKETQTNAIKALKSAEGFIRRSLGRVLTTRIVPELKFELDDSIAYSIHIQKVLDTIGQEGDGNKDGSEA